MRGTQHRRGIAVSVPVGVPSCPPQPVGKLEEAGAEKCLPRHDRRHPSSLGWLLVGLLWCELRGRARCYPVLQHGLTPVRWLKRTLALPELRVCDESNLYWVLLTGAMGAS